MVILIDPAQVPHNRYFERIEPLFAALRRRILKETALIYPKIIMVIIMQPHRWDKTLRWRKGDSNPRSLSRSKRRWGTPSGDPWLCGSNPEGRGGGCRR